MTPELEALARRAVARPHWRWVPGMRYRLSPRHPWLRYEGDDAYDDNGDQFVAAPPNCRSQSALPDLADHATLGCLLALVREAYGDPTLYVRRGSTRRESDGIIAWEVLGWLSPERSPDGRAGSWRGWGYASEAEALVAALEGAP